MTMDSSAGPLALVVIAGPQASGKSTLAAALATDLRSRGERVALVELDQIAGMALPTLPSWEDAHQIFETVTSLWLRTDVTCVIAEGSGSWDEVARILKRVPATPVTVTVATTAPFEAALARAQADPTRGISKERDFLTGVYEQWSREVDGTLWDLLIDTGDTDIDHGVARIEAALASARGASAL
ncbi:hypothetical protein [Labedella endophytica]|uniref:Adenylyl-sulfate kinase n=1 Tax=Labedella endophytica TaxID=1523160 RepID=A0A433JTM6_9MICO|nr:hypothetical protein [Labedella endophytica]RUR01550.1 hypothetical protein ELQ94_08645 [Labedella endophytica]